MKVLKIEAEAAQYIVLTFDDNEKNEYLDFEQAEKQAELKCTFKKKKTMASEAHRTNVLHLWQVLPK